MSATARNTRWGVLLLLTALMSGPAFAQAPRPTATEPTVARKLQAVLDRVVSESPDHLGILASVDAPGLHLDWTGASGKIARDSDVPLRPDQPFRIASVTKVYVAAAIFKLIEAGRLGLYDPISEYISPQAAKVLRSGGYDPEAITVEQLLGMTSGLADFGPNPAYLKAVLQHQREHKRWTRLEQIEFTVRYEKKVGSPGERYYYSDTGYVILGAIIERVSGLSMPAYVRKSLDFAGLGLNSTYWETLEPAPPGLPPRAHQYWGDIDVTHFDPSLDLWGGGGLVSTTADLDRFFRGLFTGHIFERHSTLAMALLPDQPKVPRREPGPLMLDTYRFGPHECYAHGGFWGTIAMYCPDIDVAVATTIDQSFDESTLATQRKLERGLAAVVDSALRAGRE